MQNFAPMGFSAEQFWQRIDPPIDQHRNLLFLVFGIVLRFAARAAR